MNTLEALTIAIKALDTPAKTVRQGKAIEVLKSITIQRGCEHFDPAVEDGRLTDLIDIIVFG